MSEITAAQRQQLARLGRHVDAVVAADRIYFEQHPERKHRIRVSDPTEIAMGEILDGRAWTPPESGKWFTIIRHVADGVRARLFAIFYDDAPTDTDEATAREVFKLLETEHTRALEAEFLRARGGNAA